MVIWRVKYCRLRLAAGSGLNVKPVLCYLTIEAAKLIQKLLIYFIDIMAFAVVK